MMLEKKHHKSIITYDDFEGVCDQLITSCINILFVDVACGKAAVACGLLKKLKVVWLRICSFLKSSYQRVPRVSRLHLSISLSLVFFNLTSVAWWPEGAPSPAMSAAVGREGTSDPKERRCRPKGAPPPMYVRGFGSSLLFARGRAPV